MFDIEVCSNSQWPVLRTLEIAHEDQENSKATTIKIKSAKIKRISGILSVWQKYTELLNSGSDVNFKYSVR